ncbi:MAG: response regulator [Rhodocyclales bacterium]|nr:response regulator [Rhodocyclales bacterium]
MRLLLVEDHSELAEWVSRALSQAGYAVDVLARGDHADHALLTQPYDLVILDLSLPGLDGLEVLHRLRSRERGSPTPVLVLTARGATEDRVKGLNLGADDYLPKPFELSELEARIKALLRRSGNLAPTVRIGRLEFDTTTRLASLDGKPLALTPRELAVLEVLISRLGRPVARELLFEKVFRFDEEARVEAIEIYVHRLRKKIEGSGATVSTLRGLGYLLGEAPVGQ